MKNLIGKLSSYDVATNQNAPNYNSADKASKSLLKKNMKRNDESYPNQCEFQVQRMEIYSKSCRTNNGAASSVPCEGKNYPIAESVFTPSSLYNAPHFSRHQLYCIVFLLLLLTSEYADAVSGSSLLSLDLKIGPNSNLLSPIVTNNIDAEPKHTATGLITFSLRHRRLANPVKRNVNPRMRFLSDHRRGQRLVTKQGHYIEIKSNGKVKGSRRRTVYSIFELISIRPGVIALKSKKTGRYLAMDQKGNLVGLKTHTPACNFYERMIENKFFVYFQNIKFSGKRRAYIKQVYMGFDNKGRPKKGKRVHRNDNSAHFQKRPVVYPLKRRSGPKKRRGKKARPKKFPTNKNA